MRIFWSESRGKTEEKAKWSVWLRKQEVGVLDVNVLHRMILNVNNSLNVKIRKKKL